MDSNTSPAAGADSAATTVKPYTSAKFQAMREEGLRLLEERMLRQKRQAQLEEQCRAAESALLEEKKLPEEKKFDVLSFVTEVQRKRRYLETIRNIIGKR